MSDAPARRALPPADPNRDPRVAHEAREAALNPDVRQAPDAPAYRGIILSIIGTMGVGGILILAATLVLDNADFQRRPGGLPRPDTAHAGPDKVGQVFQTQIFEEVPATEVKRKRLQRLEAYGWVSKSHGIVRIPIDSAIDIVLHEQPAPAPGGAIEAPETPGPPRGMPTVVTQPGGMQRGGVQRKPVAKGKP